ncbi:hypothetical protein [Halalkalibacterium halodurans]|jgi:hypothetical protein|uniref:MacB-like periplasmic core domain-containing protein n=1 Tax=Halalkalibacterium halodurans TaxID=86665 RepID=A0A0M0KKW2_ALKHA|nr:hypothetical protein [Halalkalibacterium halodurans]TPE70880.1 hypothetical protein AMD02_000355 [Halalkalibacterium halodurans]
MNQAAMTKLRKNGTLTIGALFGLFSLLMMALSAFQIKQDELNMVTRGLYDPRAVAFTFEDLGQAIDWKEIDTDRPFTVFTNPDEPIRGFYYQRETYIPPMISGRFFKENDFYRGQKYIVVGQAIDQQTIDNWQQQGYRLLGIMGASYASAIDHLILVNLDAMEQGKPAAYYNEDGEPVASEIYVINSHDKLIVGDELHFNHHTVFRVNTIAREDVGVFRFLEFSLFQIIISVLSHVLIFSLTLLFSFYWLEKQRTECIILWHLGIQLRKPYSRYALTLFGLLSISYGLIGILTLSWMLIFNHNLQTIIFHTNNMLIGYLLMLLAISASISLGSWRVKKTIYRREGVKQ